MPARYRNNFVQAASLLVSFGHLASIFGGKGMMSQNRDPYFSLSRYSIDSDILSSSCFSTPLPNTFKFISFLPLKQHNDCIPDSEATEQKNILRNNKMVMSNHNTCNCKRHQKTPRQCLYYIPMSYVPITRQMFICCVGRRCCTATAPLCIPHELLS